MILQWSRTALLSDWAKGIVLRRYLSSGGNFNCSVRILLKFNFTFSFSFAGVKRKTLSSKSSVQFLESGRGLFDEAIRYPRYVSLCRPYWSRGSSKTINISFQRARIRSVIEMDPGESSKHLREKILPALDAPGLPQRAVRGRHRA